ncbi:MAG: hypothetical protein ABR535_09775 [Pyrinomonadaceae bacterium]
MVRKIAYLGFENCLEMTNDDVRIVVATDFGPRILFYGFDETENVLGWHPDAAVETELGTWKPYGGHRLWLAPENIPMSYAPDNQPVDYQIINEYSVTLSAQADAASVQKSLKITLCEKGGGVTINHKITNRGAKSIEAAAWALTIMQAGGEAIVPNEPLRPYGPETLLPVRTMSLWPYTDFTDPRWRFEKEFTGLRCDESISSPQKFGVLNRQGRVQYQIGDVTFTKRFDFAADASYPDMNSNTEIYTAGGFIEVETLSPLKSIEPGEVITHREFWELA